jgi:hypothetical protein
VREKREREREKVIVLRGKSNLLETHVLKHKGGGRRGREKYK